MAIYAGPKPWILSAFHIQRTLTTTARDRVHILNTQPRGGGFGNGSKGVLIR